MKKILPFIMLIVLSISVFAEVPDDLKVVARLKTGFKQSELKLNKEDRKEVRDGLAGGDDYVWGGPSAFCFDNDNNLVILD